MSQGKTGETCEKETFEKTTCSMERCGSKKCRNTVAAKIITRKNSRENSCMVAM